MSARIGAVGNRGPRRVNRPSAARGAGMFALPLALLLAAGPGWGEEGRDALDDLLGTGPRGSAASESSAPEEAAVPAAREDEAVAPSGAGGSAAGPHEAEAAVAPPRKPSRSGRVIEEIVVTAQKKEQSIQDVPISISALSGEFLKEAGIANLHELAEFTPNVRFMTNACCTTVFIRGFGTPFAAGVFDPTVGLALDELSIPKEIYMSDPLYDIERFEVLRGPQGTLFGKNTPAGLFNVTTGMPTAEYTGYVLGSIGDLGVHRVEAAIGGPIGAFGDVVRFRLAAVQSQEAGDVRNTIRGIDEPAAEQQAARLKLELRPFPGLEALVIGSRAVTDSGYFHIQSFRFRDATVDWVRQFDPRFEDDAFDHQNSIDFAGHHVRRDTDLLQTNIRYSPGDLGWLRAPEIVAVLGMTGFDQPMGFDMDFSPADVAILDRTANNFPYDQRSVEVRAAGFLPGPFGFGEAELLIGGLLFDSDLESEFPLRAGRHFDDYLLSPAGYEIATGMPPPGGVGFSTLGEAASAFGVPPPPTPEALEGDGVLFFVGQKTRSQALFGRAAWTPFDRWELSFGGRLTFEQKDARVLNDCFDPGFVCGALGIEEFDIDPGRSETDFSPKVTVQYYPFDDLTLFATRAQGFKSGGFNNFSFRSDAVEVDSEKAVSWEVGAKGSLLGDALSYAGTFFNMEVDDLQLQNTRGALIEIRNAASARARGFELDFHWLAPWEPLSVRGAGAITDGKFTSFPDAPPVAGSGESSQNLSGRRMPFVAERQLSVTPELRFPLALPAFVAALVPRDLDFTTAFDVLYRSDFFLDGDLDPRTRQGGYVKLGGRMGVGTADGALSFALLADNLTDVGVLEYQIDSLLYPGGYSAIQEFQRRFAVQAAYHW